MFGQIDANLPAAYPRLKINLRKGLCVDYGPTFVYRVPARGSHA